MIWQASAVPLVSSAIEGKYGAHSRDIVERRMAELGPILNGGVAERELRSHLKAPNSPEDDISNQLILLALIENYWSANEYPFVSIVEMHAALFGDQSVDALRDRNIISDFGGMTLISWEEVVCRIDEVERACRELHGEVHLLPLSFKAQFLAYVFASIIRIHAFPDGNGRTARMYAQYLLRLWDYSYIVIPKVRNDGDWREALEGAVAGDPLALRHQFARRMVYAGTAPHD